MRHINDVYTQRYNKLKKTDGPLVRGRYKAMLVDVDNYLSVDSYAKLALNRSYENCLNFPWIRERVDAETLKIHQWFFDIKSGKIFAYSSNTLNYEPLATLEA
jgi:carbonic anhydrase